MDKIEKLEQEIEIAENASKAWDLFIEGHVMSVKAEVYIAFEELASDDIEGLKKVKNLQIAIGALEQSVKSVIMTGELARLQLEENNNG